MNCLTDLKNHIQSNYNKTPTSWDGMRLAYDKVEFGLISVDDKWLVFEGKKKTVYNSKQLKQELKKIVSRCS